MGRCSRAGRLPGGGAVWQGSVHLAACSPVCSSGRGAGQGAQRRPPCPRCWGRGGCPGRVGKGASGGGAARAKARRRESAGWCGQRERGGGVRAGGGWDAESGPSPSCSPLRGLRFRLSFLCPRGRAACQAGFIRLHLRASACCAQEGGTEGPRATRMSPEPHLPRASASQVNLSGSEPPPRPPGVMVLTLQMRKLRLRAPRHFPKAPQPLTCHGYESSFEPCLLLQEAFPN